MLFSTLMGSAQETTTTTEATDEATPQEVNYSDIEKGTFYARGVYGLRSMADGEHFTAITPEKDAIVKYRYSDGEAVDTLFTTKGREEEFPILGYSFSADESLIMLPTEPEAIYRHSYKAENWIYDTKTDKLTRLSPNGKQQIATFSPDGLKAAFVREGNLFWVDLATSEEVQATQDGQRNSIINGLCDWVYEEEFGFDRAYEWNSSSDKIAYYRFDERDVKQYYMPVFKGELYPENMSFKYPKAGEDNSEVSIRVYDIRYNTHNIIDEVSKLNDGYFPRVEWTGRKDELALHKINREQNKYELILCNTALSSATSVFTETAERYIDRVDENKVQFIPELNRIVVMSEVDGYRHLYLYDFAGKFIRQLTSGEWEVTAINAIDARGGKLYFSAAKESPLYREPYVVGLTNRKALREPQRLNSAKSDRGVYSVSFSKGAKYYVQTYSDKDTPTITTVHSASNGKELRVLQDNAKLRDTLQYFSLPEKKFITVLAADGVTELNGYILLPQDFDESKQYPLFMTQYSGPGSQSVADSWGIGWETALLAEGYLVACIDGRGTGYRGFDFRSCTYKDLGNLEVQDQIAAAKYFGELSYIDSSRIGIYGWSYGGFMSLNCILKGADIFSMAIAIAPVTSWRYYDTIYTEIYNGVPQTNAEGYDDNSPINFADKLEGKLLLVHGTADDNVHIQNSYDMISALNKAGKDFEMLIYPDKNHSMGDCRGQLMYKCIDFVKKNL